MAKRNQKIEHEVSGGNVLADLGVQNPQDALAKAQLARAICLLVEGEGLTQKAIAERLGIDQPKVSALLRGRLSEFSTDRLLRFVPRLGHDVKISVQSRRAKKAHASLEVALVR
jgi:predicted XRE-type DNA-binding protein